MLRFFSPRLGVSPFSLFLMEQRKNPRLRGLAVGVRGRKTAEMYHALSEKDLASLKKRAAAKPSFNRASHQLKIVARAIRKPRLLSGYNKFVKTNYAKVRHLPHLKRLQVLAKEWKAKQKGHSSKTAAKSKPRPAVKRTSKSKPKTVVKAKAAVKAKAKQLKSKQKPKAKK